MTPNELFVFRSLRERVHADVCRRKCCEECVKATFLLRRHDTAPLADRAKALFDPPRDRLLA